MATQTAESMECGDGAATQQPAFAAGAPPPQQYFVIGEDQRIAMPVGGGQPPVIVQGPPGAVPRAPLHLAVMPMPPPPRLQDNPYCQLCNFDIEKKIGRGQFSVVYRARCKLNDQIVALKKIQMASRCLP